MRNKLHIVVAAVFLLVLFYDLIVWGAVKDLPEAGLHIRTIAQRQAPLALTYMTLGEPLDAALPFLHGYGLDTARRAFEPAFVRIAEDTNLAITLLFDRTYNSTHAVLKALFYAAPVLLVLFLLLWWRRPRQIRLGRP